MEVIDRVLRTIREHDMIPPGACVLCAVSGGADSVAMLLALRALSGRLGIALRAAHVNHGLRGAESDRDEHFVRALCARLEIPLDVHRADVAAIACERGQGIEACARDVRYVFFCDVMRMHGIKRLATAHTAKDNLETALFNLARGTGITGVAGIPAVRREKEYIIIRPMLRLSRADVEAYLSEQGESFVTDSTNASDAYTRNYIRHQVLPALESLNPSLYATAAATQQQLRQDADFIERAVDNAYSDLVQDHSICADAFAALHPAIAGRLVQRIYRELLPDGAQLTAANCREVTSIARSADPSAHADLPGGVIVQREYDYLRFLRSSEPTRLVTRALRIGETTAFPEAGIAISCRVLSNPPKDLRSVHNFYFDYSHIHGILSVRARMAGDKILLVGRTHHTDIRKWMIDHKVPRLQRELVSIICDENGILAVDGLGVAQRVAMNADTCEILEINIFEDTRRIQQ